MPAGRRLLAAGWAPFPAKGGKLLFIVDGARLSPQHLTAAGVDGAEIGAFSCRERRGPDLVIPRPARQVHAAIETRTTRRATNREHGTAHLAGG